MPFSYRFLDESFNQMYRAEQRIGRIILIFSTLAILIACLGLFGLSTFIAEQRTKEIGIRKVLGASVSGIVQLLSKDFIKLVALSFIFAAPLAWYFMNKWLQDFAYRIHISWWIFLLAGVLAVTIALVTVSFQAIKAALMNPVRSLRTE
jgi:putative ABC transport system permease protein